MLSRLFKTPKEKGFLFAKPNEQVNTLKPDEGRSKMRNNTSILEKLDRNEHLSEEELDVAMSHLENELGIGRIDTVSESDSGEEKKRVVRDEFPFTFDDYIGQDKPKELLKINALNPKFHPLVAAHRGLGKSTFLELLAEERGKGKVITVIGGAMSVTRVHELLLGLEPWDMVIIDEIHRLPDNVAEYLLSCVQEGIAYFVKDKNGKSMHRFKIPEGVMWAGATTELGDVLKPLLDRMVAVRLSFYSNEDIIKMVKGTYGHMSFTEDALDCIADNSQGVPRIALKGIVNAMNPYMDIYQEKVVDKEFVEYILDLLEIKDSLSYNQRLYMVNLLAGTMSSKSLAATLGVQLNEITETIEPYLKRKMFIRVTATGRELTEEGRKLAKEYKKEFVC